MPAPFVGINVEIKNLDKIQLRLGATDKQVANAVRNAQDEQANFSKRKVDRKISAGIGLPGTEVRRRTYTKRVNPRVRPYATVSFAGITIPIKHWDHRIVQSPKDNTGTRAFIVVRNTYTGDWDRPYAFVNPKGRAQATLVRFSNRKSDVRLQGGLTIRRPFQETINNPFLRETEKEFEERVVRKVTEQVLKVK